MHEESIPLRIAGQGTPLDGAENDARPPVRNSHDATEQVAGTPRCAEDISAASRLLLCREELVSIEGGYQKRKQNAVLRVYGVAIWLSENEGAWTDFCRRSEWESWDRPPRPENRELALRYALRFAIGFSAGNNKEVSRYFCILQPHIKLRHSVPEVETIMDDAGGLLALGRLQKAAETDAKSKSARISSDYEDVLKRHTLLLSIRNLSTPNPTSLGVDGILADARTFQSRDVMILEKLAAKSRGLLWLHLLSLAIHLAKDRDAWDEFCRSPRWFEKKKKPHVDRPERAFFFITLAVWSNAGIDMRKNAMYRAAKPVWHCFLERNLAHG